MQHPAAALAIAVGAVVVLDEDNQGLVPITSHFYQRLPGMPVNLTVVDFLVATVVIGIVFDRARRRARLAVPRAFLPVALLIGGAVLWGMLVGRANAWNSNFAFSEARGVVYLLLVPVLVVNVVDSPAVLKRFVWFAGALAAFKGLEGMLGWLAGRGRPIGPTHLTYYEPLPNAIMMGFLVTVAAAAVARVRMPRWVMTATPLVAGALLLSFRRSFWIAAVVALVIAVLVASGRRGRPVVVLLGALVVVAGYAVVNVGGSAASQNTLVQRATSLSPSSLKGNADDRYRLDEQRNVFEELRRQPIRGIGLGVPWAIRYPLSQHFVDGQYYTHVAAFWWWTKMGILGLLAYVASVVGGAWMAFVLWRQHPDPRGRVIGLGIAASFIGLSVAELTGSFTGVDFRLSMGLAAAWGGLAAAINLIQPVAAIPA
ncbi:MAG: hypothetical protein JWO37_1704 [Acidimicrobiales bacterium]|jgi:O-antigen ligase|nr:hypothetical protein [Acidimicrobiales bacterium]